MRKLPANSHSSGPTATAPVVDSTPPTALMAGAYPKIMSGGGIRAQIVSDQLIGEPSWLSAGIVFETGRMAPILFHGLSQLSLPVVCVESRQAYQALKSLATHKTD